MARYIDADLIPYYLDTSYEAPMEGRKITFKSDIDKIPTADVAPKSEIEREIFMDIDRVVEKYSMGDIEYPAFINIIAELKKKYTEGEG